MTLNQPRDWAEIKILIESWYVTDGLSLCAIFKRLVEGHRAVVSLPALKKRIDEWGWTARAFSPEELALLPNDEERMLRQRGTYAVLRLETKKGLLKVDIIDREQVGRIMANMKPSKRVASPPPPLRQSHPQQKALRTIATPERRDTGDSGYQSGGSGEVLQRKPKSIRQLDGSTPVRVGKARSLKSNNHGNYRDLEGSTIVSVACATERLQELSI